MSRVDQECLQSICRLVQPPKDEVRFEELMPLVLSKLQQMSTRLGSLDKDNARLKSKLEKQNDSRDLLEGQCELRLVQLQQELKDQQKVVSGVQKEYDLQIKLLKEEKEMIKSKTSKFQKGLTEL